MKRDIYLNDSIHGLISLTEYERRIVSTIGFNRLHDVYQNSTVYLTYPTNRIKRFEHSIGTMKLCSDMFYHSVLNTPDAMLIKFYQIFEKEYEHPMPHFPQSMLRHSLIPNNIPKEYKVLHLLLIESVRAAALLHDIGHPPFSHIVEFALKDVYKEFKEKEDCTFKNAKEFLAIMSKYFEGNKKLHEQMGDEITEGILTKIIVPLEEDGSNYDQHLFEQMILYSVKKIFSEEGPFQYLHRIIDSSLDGDRLDYVTRDVLSSGKESGKIEYDRIINDMQLIVEGEKIYFCVPLKAVGAVEDFLKRRYLSYKEIIYHHRVIKTDFILEGIVKELVRQYLMSEKEQNAYNSDVLIPFDISGLWFPLGEKKSRSQANALSQWNDSWLITVLRQIYYTRYYHNEEIKAGTKEYLLAQRLAELLRNSKRYHSIIKRSENFKVIDDAVKAELKDCIKPTSGFVLAYIDRNKDMLNLPDFEEMVSEIVRMETKSMITEISTYDVVTLFKRISIGMDSPIYFYNSKNAICTLEDVSGIADILQLDSDYLPVFYIYIMGKDSEGVLKEKRDALLKSIGARIGQELKKRGIA